MFKVNSCVNYRHNRFFAFGPGCLVIKLIIADILPCTASILTSVFICPLKVKIGIAASQNPNLIIGLCGNHLRILLQLSDQILRALL